MSSALNPEMREVEKAFRVADAAVRREEWAEAERGAGGSARSHRPPVARGCACANVSPYRPGAVVTDGAPQRPSANNLRSKNHCA
jgi:hypothetical protein